MILKFLGTGEACDCKRGNTSMIVEDSDTSVLLDCGFTTPHAYFSKVDDADRLDLVWISHYHGDHFFGLPLMLLRFWEMGRHKKLTIAGPAGLEKRVLRLLDMAYAGFGARLRYPLSFKEIVPGQILREGKTLLQAAVTAHSQHNLALRLEFSGKKIFYSGDGRPSEASKKLMCDCDVIIHEAFRIRADMEDHGSVQEILDLGKRLKPPLLLLVHIGREARPSIPAVLHSVAEDFKPSCVLAPEDGDSLQV